MTTASDPSGSDQQPPILLVMDLSSSMNEVNTGSSSSSNPGTSGSGQTRLDAAKAAVIDFIGNLAAGTRVGLNTYPNDGDCGAGSTSFPLSNADTGDMARYIRSLTADGNTPTGSALDRAATELDQSANKRGVIVLVSDGESNCQGSSPPPCEVAKKLVAKGYDITVNTVGLQISDAGRAELQCIADATKGTYVDVKNPNDIKEALKSLAVPELKLSVSYPARVVLDPGVKSTVEIHATITNIGKVVAPDVESTIVYDAAFSPGSAQPRHRLGNLAPGDISKFTWTFRPNDSFKNQTVHFVATAVTDGRQTSPVNGAIAFVTPDSTTGLPSWLTSAKHIVALGDSYSSGEGVGVKGGQGPQAYPAVAFDAPTDLPYNTCHRSVRHDTAGQVAALSNPRAQVTDLACSGAVTSDVWLDASDAQILGLHAFTNTKNGKKSGPPLESQMNQLKSLFHAPDQADPDLAFMTLGGNDIGFQYLVAACVITRRSCATTPSALVLNGSSGYAYLQKHLEELSTNLTTAILSVENISRQSSGHFLPLLIPAYPLAFPQDVSTTCSLSGQVFTPENRAFLNVVSSSLNTLVSSVVSQLQRERHVPVWFVADTAGAFQKGNTYCDSDTWVNHLEATGFAKAFFDSEYNKLHQTASSQPLPNAGLGIVRWMGERLHGGETDHTWQNMAHPTQAGYRGEAEAVINWTHGHPTLQTGTPSSAGSSPLSTMVGMTDPGPTVEMTSSSVATLHPGETAVATAGGFAPFSSVTVEIASTPAALATATVDSSGHVRLPVEIRKNFPLGSHHLIVTGVDRSGKAKSLTRRVAVARRLPTWWWPLAGVALTALSGAAVSIWMLRRLRRSDAVST